MKTGLCLLLYLILFSGCRPLIMKAYGIKKPRIENEKTLVKKAMRLGLDTSNIATVNGKDFLYELKGRRIPDAAIYNAGGRYIEYRSYDSACNAGLFDFIPSLNLKDSFHCPDSADDLDTELNKLRDIKGNVLSKRGEADFYVLIYWTVWTGRLNKDHVRIWEQLAAENKQCRIKVIKVNLDLQTYWEDKERDRVIKAISKKKK